MAVPRDNPYSRFNFLVSLGTIDPNTPQAGFSDVSGLGIEVQAIEYRAGNDKTNLPRKLQVQLLSEDRQTVVQEWLLINAWPVRYSGPELSANTNDVAIEELVLTCENLEVQ